MKDKEDGELGCPELLVLGRDCASAGDGWAAPPASRLAATSGESSPNLDSTSPCAFAVPVFKSTERALDRFAPVCDCEERVSRSLALPNWPPLTSIGLGLLDLSV